MSSPDRIEVTPARPGASGFYRLNETGRLIDASEDLLKIFAVESIQDFDSDLGSREQRLTRIVPWHSPQSKSGQMFADYFSRNLPISQCQTDIEIAGQTRTIVETLVPVRNAAGHLEQWLGTIHDFTAMQTQHVAAIDSACARAESRESQFGELCDQVRWALGRVRESIRAGDSACMTNAFCDTIEHLVNLESEFNAGGESEADSNLQALSDRRQGFRLCELVEDLAESAASEIHRAGRRITVQIDQDLPPVVRGNLQTIHCVLANLLHHAASRSDWGDVKLIASKNGNRTTFAMQLAKHSFSVTSDRLHGVSPEEYPSEWRIASRYIQRLHSDLKTRFLPSGWLEVAFDAALVEDTDLRSSQHPELILGENTRVLVVTAHAATRDALSEILARWRIASSACGELDVALQRIRINEKMGRRFDAILIDESIFATRQTLSTETLECLATSANIRIQSRGTTCQSSFQSHLRTPDWVWTVSEPIRQSCLRTALIGATHLGETDQSDSCQQCHSGVLRSRFDPDPLVGGKIDPPSDAVIRVQDEPPVRAKSEAMEASLLMNLEGLREECGGDQALSAVVMEVMCSSMPMRLREMQAAAQRGDLDLVTRLARQMSGAAKDQSMSAVAELTSQLTAHAISKNEQSVRTCLLELSKRIEQTIDLMQSLLEETL